jgi:acetoacetate decarboxylase
VSSIYEGECKDYEFSRRFLEDHWRAGYYDAVHTLRHGEALERPAKETLVTFDLAKGRRRLPRRLAMKQAEVRERAFAMPLTSPAYPPGPYRFVDREYLIITYRTDPAMSRALVPEPLEPDGALVKYEFIRMPDSTGFGDYTESGQVIPVSFRGRKGAYAHCMFLNDEPPIAGGRELWGFPKKLANPTLHVEIDALVGTLDYGPVRVATGSMGYKHKAVDLNTVAAALAAPNFLLKIIPHVDGTPRICELVEYYLEDITLKGAWTGPAALALHPHALAPVAELPVLEVVSGLHIVADLTLGLGRVAFDYLQ